MSAETEELKQLLIAQTGKIDGLCTDISKVHQVLAGSDLGEKGMIKDLNDLKVDHYKIKANVSKLNIFAKFAGSVISAILAYIGIKISL